MAQGLKRKRDDGSVYSRLRAIDCGLRKSANEKTQWVIDFIKKHPRAVLRDAVKAAPWSACATRRATQRAAELGYHFAQHHVGGCVDWCKKWLKEHPAATFHDMVDASSYSWSSITDALKRAGIARPPLRRRGSVYEFVVDFMLANPKATPRELNAAARKEKRADGKEVSEYVKKALSRIPNFPDPRLNRARLVVDCCRAHPGSTSKDVARALGISRFEARRWVAVTRKSPALSDEDRAVLPPVAKPTFRALTENQKRAVEDSFDFYPPPSIKDVAKECGAREQACAHYANEYARALGYEDKDDLVNALEEEELESHAVDPPQAYRDEVERRGALGVRLPPEALARYMKIYKRKRKKEPTPRGEFGALRVWFGVEDWEE